MFLLWVIRKESPGITDLFDLSSEDIRLKLLLKSDVRGHNLDIKTHHSGASPSWYVPNSSLGHCIGE
jgi:hypothetical protein